MTLLAFTVHGEPRGKGRPRFSRKSGRAYTDAKTEGYEALIAYAALSARGSRPPIAEPIHVDITVRLSPVASASNRLRSAMLAGEVAILGRFDIDNVCKAVLDGMNGVAFVDDRQIVGIFARKVASETPGVDVRIMAWEPNR